MDRSKNNINDEKVVSVECIDGTAMSFAVFCQSGNLYVYRMKLEQFEFIVTITNITHFDDVKMYCHQSYICIIENKNINGVVIDINQREIVKMLNRGDYQVEHCSFPIGFVERENETLLIHGTDWNRLDITRLRDDLLLTNRNIEYPDTHYFDYFHSSLVVSKDNKYFAVNGWVWNPVDRVIIFSVDDFLKQYEKCFKSIEMIDVFSGYNWDRPLCFMGNHFIAIGHNPNEGEERTEKVPSEIFIYDINKGEKGDFVNGIPIKHRVKFNGFHMNDEYEVQGNLFYDEETDSFIGLNKVTGLMITDRKGNILIEDNTFKSYFYSHKDRIFYNYTCENGFKLEIMELDKLMSHK